MLMKAAKACTGALCCAWSTKYRWQLSYLGYHSKMSNYIALSIPFLAESEGTSRRRGSVPVGRRFDGVVEVFGRQNHHWRR